MTKDQFEAILKKLDMLVRLSAVSFLANKTQQEKIMLLSSAGFQPKEIADICGTTSNTVRVALSMIRKKHKNSKRIDKPS